MFSISLVNLLAIQFGRKIDLLDPSAVCPRPYLYRMSKDELKALKSTIKEYLNKRWIQLSISPYKAPVIAICKKTGELRIIINYRMLNK